MLITVFIFITGCQGQKRVSFDGKVISEIGVSEFRQFGEINQNSFLTVTRQEDIEILATSVKGAERIQGILDVAEAHYDMNFKFDDNTGKEYHLWLYDEGGMIMEAANTHTGYRLTQEAANTLEDLISGTEKTLRDTVRGIAYNSLSNIDKNSVVNWKSSKVRLYKAAVEQEITGPDGEEINIEGKDIYKVLFRVYRNNLPGYISIYIDKNSDFIKQVCISIKNTYLFSTGQLHYFTKPK